MASRSRWRGQILCAYSDAAGVLTAVMRHLLVRVGDRQPIGQHPAEQAKQFLLALGWQVRPPGLWRGRSQARGGTGKGWSGMVRFLRYECGVVAPSGPVRVTPTGRRSPELLYPARQRVLRAPVFVGSV